MNLEIFKYDFGNLFAIVDPPGNRTTRIYDEVSRLFSLTDPLGRTTTYNYDALNRVANITDATGGITQFTYDANGNLTFDGTTAYTWDVRNRLVQMSSGALFATFTYDALGRRVSKTINGETTQYLYDGNDIVAEIEGGVITATYLRSLNIDEPFLRSSAVAEYYHTDALGSTLALTDEAGVVRTTYSYDPFGNTAISGLSSNSFQYTGRENDGTGLYYYRARYYSPTLQRFISEDPYLLPANRGCSKQGFVPVVGSLASVAVKNPQNLNMYGYVGNGPVNFRDPLGLYPVAVSECPAPPPGCNLVDAVPILYPIEVCMPNAATGQLECFSTGQQTCQYSRCIYDCQCQSGRKDCTGGGRFELTGTCKVTEQYDL